jgi:hypothetical protein
VEDKVEVLPRAPDTNTSALPVDVSTRYAPLCQAEFIGELFFCDLARFGKPQQLPASADCDV